MKKALLTFICIGLLCFPMLAQNMVILESAHDTERTVDLLKSSIDELDVELMQHIDHKENAGQVDLDLSPVHVLLFGNPEVGTKLMQENPEVAIELPLRVLVYEKDGKTFVAYKDPREMEDNYDLQNQGEVLTNMNNVLEKITHAVVKPGSQYR